MFFYLIYLLISFFVYCNGEGEKEEEEDNFIIAYESFSKKVSVSLYSIKTQNKVKFLLSQVLPFNIIHQYPFINNEAKYFGEKKINIIGKNEQLVQEIEETLSGNKEGYYIIPNLRYYSIQYNETNINNTLSLAYDYEKGNFSIVHLLYKNKIIKHLKFTTRPLTYLEGYIYFGNIPLKEINNRKTGKCNSNISVKKKLWGCNLKRLYFDKMKEKVFEYNGFVSFQINMYKGIAPCSFFDFVANTLLQKHFDLRSCSFFWKNNKKYIQCEHLTINNMYLGSLVFEFEGLRFNMTLESLFTFYFQKDSIFRFKCLENEEQWVFGNSFLRNFIITYNYELKDVTFYTLSNYSSTVEQFQITKNVQISRNMLLGINLIICIININILLIVVLFLK